MTTYDPIYLTETEHSLLDHADVPGVPQGGATVRYFSAAEVATTHAQWTITTDVPVLTNAGKYPIFDVLTTGAWGAPVVGESDDFGIFPDSDNWGQAVPSLKTPGIYFVGLLARWPVNAIGFRNLGLEWWDTEYGGVGGEFGFGYPPVVNVYNTEPGDATARLSPNQTASGLVYVWEDAKPVQIGTTLRQNSGSTLTVAKEWIWLDAWKIAEFLEVA